MEFKIEDRHIGADHAVFIVAELSGNHSQDFDTAAKTICAMKEAGADAVKLQTYTADTMTIDSKTEYFQIKGGTLWDGKTLYELYKQAYTPWDWQPRLKKIAEDLGLICFSTAFDRSAVDFLEDMGVGAYKVASFEITDMPLIEYIASKGKPVILSTGIATYSDIKDAVDICRNMNNSQIAILKCTSTYPTLFEEANLRTISDLAERFGVVAGLSDHTLGISASVVSVALGAKIIEKHFILDKNLGGPDCAFSLQPQEFKQMVMSVREAEAALGEVSYELGERGKNNRAFSRSLFVVTDIRAGDTFTKENIKSIRPASGLHTRHLKEVLGRRAIKDIKKGTPLQWGLVA